MTELIIIGNGFDLAHGMKTAYSDYIRTMLLDALRGAPQYGRKSPFYLGMSTIEVLRVKGEYKLIAEIERLFNEPQNSGKKIQEKSSEQPRTLTELYRDVAKARYYTLSPFVSLLIEDFEKKGWVDLEQNYFDILCKSYKSKNEIKRLNEDMRLVEKSLHSYLKQIKPTHGSLSINKHITDIQDAEWQRLNALLTKTKNKQKDLSFKLNEIIDGGIERIDEENSIKTEIRHLDNKIKYIEQEKENFPSKKFVVLNFNYTDTIGLYLKESEHIHIPIHNTLNDKEIILGYGDETCEMYKTLENTNNNELLRYFKSFYYMKTSLYRELERIVSSGKFRIHLMGHSCGLSDRVLLSSLFNHENLDTIRVYYYEPSEDNNDHFDKCLNISRHFLDKHQMRCKILPLKGPEDTLEYKHLSDDEKDLLGLTKSVPLVPFSEQDIENSDKWVPLP